jgi:hypothetical protein
MIVVARLASSNQHSFEERPPSHDVDGYEGVERQLDFSHVNVG